MRKECCIQRLEIKWNWLKVLGLEINVQSKISRKINTFYPVEMKASKYIRVTLVGN